MQLDNKDNESTLEEDVIPLMLMTNEPNEDKLRFMELLYQAMAVGQVAYMDGKDPDTGEIVPLIVGIQPEANGLVSIYPLARIIKPTDESINYHVPDGAGAYSPLNVGEPIDLGISPAAADSGTTTDSGKEKAGKTEGNDKEGHTIH